jgi:Domain of unknown function (DUF4136)
MKSFLPLRALALLGVFLLCACTTSPQLDAVTDFDHQFDFSQIRKVAIQPVSRMNDAAILVSDMDVNRLNRVFTDELLRKGIQVVESNDEADMYLIWHLVTQEKTDVRSYNSMSYYNCWRCGPAVNDISVRQFTQGTLIVDMVDPAVGQSVWRSTVQSKLSSKPDADKSEELRLEAGRALFSNFPPV